MLKAVQWVISRATLRELAVAMEADHLNGTVHICSVGNKCLTQIISLSYLLQNLCLEEAKG